jgi:hypothetical protein
MALDVNTAFRDFQSTAATFTFPFSGVGDCPTKIVRPAFRTDPLYSPPFLYPILS